MGRPAPGGGMGFARALRLRCPRCGGGRVIVAWLATRPACPGCRLRLDRGEPDYWLGAILFNAIAAGVVFAGGLLGAILLTWPEPPWTALLSAGIGVMMVLPILSAPFIRLLWLAFDLCVRPVSVEDLEPAPSAAHDQIQLEAIKRLRQEEGLR